MSLPSFLQLILKILNRQGIKADVVPMYGSNIRYVITLPGVQIDNPPRNNGSKKVRTEEHKVHSV